MEEIKMFKLIVILTMFAHGGNSVSQQDYGNYAKEECERIGSESIQDFKDRFGRSASDSYYHCIPQNER